MAEDIVRKISKNGENKFVFLPREWGELGKYVKFEILSDKELIMRIV